MPSMPAQRNRAIRGGGLVGCAVRRQAIGGGSGRSCPVLTSSCAFCPAVARPCTFLSVPFYITLCHRRCYRFRTPVSRFFLSAWRAASANERANAGDSASRECKRAGKCRRLGEPRPTCAAGRQAARERDLFASHMRLSNSVQLSEAHKSAPHTYPDDPICARGCCPNQNNVCRR